MSVAVAAGPVGAVGNAALDLGGGLINDVDGQIAAAPDLVMPVMETADLARQLGGEEAHEIGQAFGVLRATEETVVVGEDGESVDIERVKRLRAVQRPEKDLVGGGPGAHEEAALEGAGRHLDQLAAHRG